MTEINPIVIAHRGASGYVPEHTILAKGIAHAMGADFLEQDVVATRDNHPVVLHDIHIDTVTNVAKVFPNRHRDDGRYYAIDFSLAELKTLNVTERFDPETGLAVFPTRYPAGEGEFRINTLAEEIRFIQNLNRSTGRVAGIYPEIKQPAWHREQDCDLSKIVLACLSELGYTGKDDPCFLQCFDEFEVRRIRNDLGYDGQLIQLIASGHDELSGTDYNRLKSPEGLADVAEVADGIGPSIDSIVFWDDEGAATTTGLVRHADQFGLKVHPWTIRADSLPGGCPSLKELVSQLVDQGVDGFFADQPDQVSRVIEELCC